MPHAFRGEVPGDTLLDSRERVAARWFALRDIFDHSGPELPAVQVLPPRRDHMPLTIVFSLTGGVGKTSLAATLARSLAAEGEKILIADTASQGLLPIYFSSDRRQPREAPPAPDSSDGNLEAPVVVRDFAVHQEDSQSGGVAENILREGQGKHRIFIDLASGTSWMVRKVLVLYPVVLVPIAPDINSVISMQAVERMFRGMADSEGRSVLPYYVLNQFDASLPLHLDVREVFRRQLGDRLLRSAIRRSPLVSEALADAMTVLDYAPDAAVSQDFRDVANWLRTVSPPATDEVRDRRWGEG
jgi:cellulose biosynthesis protein BcsQ